ncbi:MAG TPA: SDR family NAD(P)-dependent oxidoreductase [Polyangiaceae bacterium]|nr:SDR family NAD(P)-dependent oxidoreductase [Polyangiaceae bacterium]
MGTTTQSLTLITGAAGALGSAVAKHLLSLGQRLVLLDRPGQEQALDDLSAVAKDRCLAVSLDVSSHAQWQAVLGKVQAQWGAPTGAALIAGGFAGGSAFHESKPELLAQMLERNLTTAATSLRAVVGAFVKHQRGSVVLVGARPAVRPWDGGTMAEYTTSKAAVVALMQAVASEVLEHGVRVNAVLPSAMDTAANRASMPKADFNRWVSVDSMAQVIAFLLSDAARDISGAALPVYGRS